ncbi:MAG: twin-arginine translocation signal domain-containing protein, partial [Chloroflexi bacterium]|nr:twin-arginine translocation signal domain-containing protein [Chloroflexota bacterium]
MSGKISRRDFIKLSGVGTAVAAALTGCGPMSRYVVRRPYADMPEYNQTGVSTYYATTCRECPAGCGLIVRTIEGRAIKVEGNPEHPVNAGKLCSRGLTAVQGLYNPDRLQGPQHHAPRGRAATPVDWNAAIAVVQDALSNTPADKIAFLLGLGSDHLFDLVTEITAALGAPAPVRASAYEMFEARATLIQATRRVFGQERLPYFDMGQADVVFSFGANFLETWLSPVAYSRAYGQMRKGKFGRRGYLVSFEPRQSLTSGNADRWVPIVPGSEGWVALALGRLVAEQNGFEVPPLFAAADLDAIAQASGVSVEQLTQLAELF